MVAVSPEEGLWRLSVKPLIDSSCLTEGYSIKIMYYFRPWRVPQGDARLHLEVVLQEHRRRDVLDKLVKLDRLALCAASTGELSNQNALLNSFAHRLGYTCSWTDMAMTSCTRHAGWHTLLASFVAFIVPDFFGGWVAFSMLIRLVTIADACAPFSPSCKLRRTCCLRWFF